ncbi:hypothetical protein C7Y66_19250 [Chroococcidiopsis sp. CCALA 051]|uniref:hypothetical protein n=1 Tax=Chroococcidiopsis sp. CCALA 051 TaxID=869949 RepID=UPI000D0CC67F|nr:hypothetical protein [Chroococcidiopsis sp. CCALA 051]MBE9014654.1 hypothetical protein [Chroococcidiopsidales cyanobacterium LEGE 13417]PSM47562.1 hypothetical protein C7Y66_19250 [Chroococcidiopsis sp. CCALA 051]
MKLAKPEDLQVLERILYQRLQTEFSQVDRLKVGCAIGDDGALVILSQHPPQVNLNTDKTFTAIGQALQSLRPQAVQSVRVYLREAGQKQIYAQHDITLEPVEVAPDSQVILNEPSPIISETTVSPPETELSPPVVQPFSGDRSIVDEPPAPPIPTVEEPLPASHVIETPPAPFVPAVEESEPPTSPVVIETPLATTTEQPLAANNIDLSTSDRTPAAPAAPELSSPTEAAEPSTEDEAEITAGDSITETKSDPISSPQPLKPPVEEPQIKEAPAAESTPVVNREDVPVETSSLSPATSSPETSSETWRSRSFEQRLETIAKPEPATQAESTAESTADSTTNINTATLPYPVLPLQRLPKAAKTKIPRAALIAGGGVAIVAFFSSAYVLSSPCTIGRCQQFATAKQLYQESNRIVQGAKQRSELIDAEKQLQDANNLLKQIPPWSSRHQEAQNFSSTIANRATNIDRVLAALEEGDTAANKLKQPIRSLEDWRAIQALWQRAIASLSAVPKDSDLYPLAQKKTTEYRGSLQAVEQKMQAEQQAFQKFPQAQSSAQAAQQQQLTARSLQAWQIVRTNWQNAVDNLSSIPQSSTTYQQAQQLLAQYRPQLQAASDRVAKETISTKAFSQAVNSAELAERQEQQNQFATAQTNWRQALIFAQQIPSGTQYYDRARSLINTYTAKLEQANSNLQGANLTQKVRADLDRACSGRIRVCRYKLDNKQIFVQLTSSYEQAVEKTFINARLRADSKAQADIATQYRTLKQVLEGISNATRLPLQIYASDGGQMHSYTPKNVSSEQ